MGLLRITVRLALFMGVWAATAWSAEAQVTASERRRAAESVRYEDYRAALPIYEKILEANTDDPDANFQFGICLIGLGRASEAYPYLIKARDAYTGIDPKINLAIAQSQHAAGNFDAAIASYEDYASFIGDKTENKEALKAELQKYIRQCQVGRTLMLAPKRAKIENLGPIVNTRFKESTPVITADNSVMFLTSRREGSTGGDMDEKNEYFEDIYVTQNKGGQWTMPANLGSPVNSNSHDAAIALSPNGQQLFVYKDDGEGDIYVSQKKGLNWTKPRSLGKSINTSKYREPSVSVTADGRYIYFSSNRPKGYGGLDIYRAKRLPNGTYAEVENLGPTVNTAEDEDGPFIHPDGVTLYFSSRGHETMGDYDIFSTQLEKGAWSVPENIGYPINTPGADIYFVLSADGQYGYYASEKKGGYGFTDIYRIVMGKSDDDSAQGRAIAIANPGLDTSMGAKATSLGANAGVKQVHTSSRPRFVTPLVLLKGIVSDADGKQPVGGLVTVVDNETGETVFSSEANEATGEYLVVLPAGKNYGISVTAKDYLFASENFLLPGDDQYKEFVKNIELKKAVTGARIVLRNIFFDTDKSTLRKQSNAELDKVVELMKQNANLKVEISGHTDNVGAADYNQRLSESRAEAVVNYLVKKGVSKFRLEAKGYGLTRPVSENDSEAGRQLNRRTELEVK